MIRSFVDSPSASEYSSTNSARSLVDSGNTLRLYERLKRDHEQKTEEYTATNTLRSPCGTIANAEAKLG